MDALDLVAVAETYQDEIDPTVRTGWGIKDLGTLDWSLLRLAECEAEAAEIEAQYDATVKRLTNRRVALLAKAGRGASFFRERIAEYAGANRAALLGGGKKKSREFIHGRVAWRTKGGRIEVTDKAALAEWLLRQPVESGLWRTRVEPEMRELQALAKSSGEIPPGCEWVPEREDLTIEAAAPEMALTKG